MPDGHTALVAERRGIASIRAYYGVPAKRGGRVRLGRRFGPFAGCEGVITGSERGAMRLLIRLDGQNYTGIYHPTWELEYLDV
jgi:hypothetical protein